MPRLQFNGKLRFRQYLISDPPTIYYTEFYTSLKENSSADWQQQMTIIPTNLHNSDLQSDRRHCHTTTLRLLPLIDNYNSYYPDPDFSFNPYWDIQFYNQHHLHFYKDFTKNSADIEPDQPQIDQLMKTRLSTAKCADSCPLTNPGGNHRRTSTQWTFGHIDGNSGRTLCEHANLTER